MEPMPKLQTDGPLPEIRMHNTNRPVSWLIFGAGEFDTDQPYQRGDVWGDTRRRNLIRWLIMGIPIPSIIINDRFTAGFRHPGYDQDRLWANAVVDGKQRTKSIVGFGRDEFAIPASWLPADRIVTTEETQDGPYVRFSGLSTPGQRFFSNIPIGVCEGHFKTMEGERLVFDLVNFGGVAQGDSDV